jgi:hypothetical protein
MNQQIGEVGKVRTVMLMIADMINEFTGRLQFKS